MNFSAIISRRNEVFYREARRAKDIKEINESAGLKYLLDIEIKTLRDYACQEILSRMELYIEEDYMGEFILVLKDKR